MKYVLRSLLLLSLALLCTCASAEFFSTVSTLPENFNKGMQAYYDQDYETASEYFFAAGNMQDAKLWAYYCKAIDSVVNGSGTKEELESASARFELLSHQSFQQAEQWKLYCEGRLYELKGMGDKKSTPLYSQILIHDSIERYMACFKKPYLLESEASVKKRMAGLSVSTKDAYEMGMRCYMEDKPEEYKKAADYFCLAGNYEDARQWRCFCLAISLVLNDDNTEDAGMIFKLLEQLNFTEAAPWATYCTARNYEKKGISNKALPLYQTIFIHDSSERYLRLLGVE